MRRAFETIVIVITLALVAACAETGQDAGTADEAPDTPAAGSDTAVEESEDFSEAEAAIAEANAAFEEAVAAGDIEGAARGAYTADATIYPPGAEPISGMEAIVQFWTELHGQVGFTGVPLETVELHPAGDGMAWEVGEAVVEGPDGPMDHVSFLIVWKRTPDGWKWHRDIWNSDGPQDGGADSGT